MAGVSLRCYRDVSPSVRLTLFNLSSMKKHRGSAEGSVVCELKNRKLVFTHLIANTLPTGGSLIGDYRYVCVEIVHSFHLVLLSAVRTTLDSDWL